MFVWRKGAWWSGLGPPGLGRMFSLMVGGVLLGSCVFEEWPKRPRPRTPVVLREPSRSEQRQRGEAAYVEKVLQGAALSSEQMARPKLCTNMLLLGIGSCHRWPRAAATWYFLILQARAVVNLSALFKVFCQVGASSSSVISTANSKPAPFIRAGSPAETKTVSCSTVSCG